MKLKPLAETHKFTPTEHISFSFGNIQFVENYFSKLDLSQTFSKLKKKGVDLTPMVEGLVAYKLHDNFSIHNAHKWLMQPEIREHYRLPCFNEKTLYRAVETIGEHRYEILDYIQNRALSTYHFEHTNIYLDWTSITLHGFKAPLGEFGYSRDHHPNKPQITLGIAELASPANIPIGVTTKPGNVNDITHFPSTFTQISKKLLPKSLVIFDKGANSEKNLDLIQACGHDYLTAKKMNTSDDKILSTFWERDPECIDQERGIYGLKVVKPSSVNYIYFSETLHKNNLVSLERRIMRDYDEAESIENSVSKMGNVPRKYRCRNPLLKIGYSVQTKLKTMTKEEALDFLRRERLTGREGFFILRSSRNLTLEEALYTYREKDSIEKIIGFT